MRPADRLQQVVARIGGSEALEKPAAKATDQIRPLVSSTPVKNALSGTRLRPSDPSVAPSRASNAEKPRVSRLRG